MGNEIFDKIKLLNEKIDDQPLKVYEDALEIVKDESLIDLSPEIVVNLTSVLIDVSRKLGKKNGINKSIEIIKECLEAKDLPSNLKFHLEYNLGNAYSHLRTFQIQDSDEWNWEKDELEKEIYHFRKALTRKTLENIESERLCPIYTNLGNAFSKAGRFIEAIEYFNKALEINKGFPQALGNKGIAYFHYTIQHYDSGHKKHLIQASYKYLQKALKSEKLFPEMREEFKKYVKRIKKHRLFKNQNLSLEEYPLGETEEEKKYRKWCLNQKLFLNSLNDVYSHSIAGKDILHLASVSGNDSRIISCVGFFNQMKQEYISARYLLYEGIHNKDLHFSDKQVYLEDTLDHPEYSLNTEKTRIAFRMSYSLFDKIANFLQYYYELDYIEDHKLNFGNVWYKSRGKNKIAPEFREKRNLPLKGLFWLSKDLEYKSEIYVQESIDPGAKKLRDIRNNLEHSYLKLHESPIENNESSISKDELAMSFYKDDFENKTLEIIEKVRAALIYLSLAIGWEEEENQKKSDITRVRFNMGKYRGE